MRIVLSPTVATLAVVFACTPSWGQSSGIVHLLSATPITVSGITVDSSGKPVQGVRIEHIAVRSQIGIVEPSAETDANGGFRFDTIAPAIVFRKNGFDSQFARIPGSQSELRIVLQAAPVKDAIPIRRTASECVSVTTGILCLPKVKGVQIGNTGGSIDAFERSFTVRTASGPWQMIHGAGPSWGGPNPRSREAWSSVAYKERIREGDGIQVIDASGRTSDGKVWRSVAVSGESAFYFDLDADAAAIMDRVLDGLCLIRK
jgi:hypothetical protein